MHAISWSAFVLMWLFRSWEFLFYGNVLLDFCRIVWNIKEIFLTVERIFYNFERSRKMIEIKTWNFEKILKYRKQWGSQKFFLRIWFGFLKWGKDFSYTNFNLDWGSGLPLDMPLVPKYPFCIKISLMLKISLIEVKSDFWISSSNFKIKN